MGSSTRRRRHRSAAVSRRLPALATVLILALPLAVPSAVAQDAPGADEPTVAVRETEADGRTLHLLQLTDDSLEQWFWGRIDGPQAFWSGFRDPGPGERLNLTVSGANASGGIETMRVASFDGPMPTPEETGEIEFAEGTAVIRTLGSNEDRGLHVVDVANRSVERHPIPRSERADGESPDTGYWETADVRVDVHGDRIVTRATRAVPDSLGDVGSWNPVLDLTKDGWVGVTPRKEERFAITCIDDQPDRTEQRPQTLERNPVQAVEAGAGGFAYLQERWRIDPSSQVEYFCGFDWDEGKRPEFEFVGADLVLEDGTVAHTWTNRSRAIEMAREFDFDGAMMDRNLILLQKTWGGFGPLVYDRRTDELFEVPDFQPPVGTGVMTTDGSTLVWLSTPPGESDVEVFRYHPDGGIQQLTRNDLNETDVAVDGRWVLWVTEAEPDPDGIRRDPWTLTVRDRVEETVRARFTTNVSSGVFRGERYELQELEGVIDRPGVIDDGLMAWPDVVHRERCEDGICYPVQEHQLVLHRLEPADGADADVTREPDVRLPLTDFGGMDALLIDEIRVSEGWVWLRAAPWTEQAGSQDTEIFALQPVVGRVGFNVTNPGLANRAGVPADTFIPLPHVQVEAEVDGRSVQTTTSGNGRFALPLAGPLPTGPGADFPVNLTVRLAHAPVNGTVPFRIVDHSQGNAGNVVEVSPTSRAEMPGDRWSLEVDLSDLSSTGVATSLEGGLTRRLDDLAYAYHRTHQAYELLRDHLHAGRILDDPVDVRMYSTDSGVFFNSDGDDGYVNVDNERDNRGDPTHSRMIDADAPDNRLWHEFGHAVMWASGIGGRQQMPQDWELSRYNDTDGDGTHNRADFIMVEGNDAGSPLEMELQAGSQVNQRRTMENHVGYPNADSTDSYEEGFAEFYSGLVGKLVAGETDPWLYDLAGGQEDHEQNTKIWSGSIGNEEDTATGTILVDLHDPRDPGDADNASVPAARLWRRLVDANVSELADLPEAFPRADLRGIFEAHDAYEDLDGDRTLDPDEPIGSSRWALLNLAEDSNDDGMLRVADDRVVLRQRVTAAPEDFVVANPPGEDQVWWIGVLPRPGRGRERPTPGSLVRLDLVDAATRESMGPVRLEVCLDFSDPAAGSDRCYRTHPVNGSGGAVHLDLPTSYAMNATVRPIAEEYEPGPALGFTDRSWASQVTTNLLRGEETLATLDGVMRPAGFRIEDDGDGIGVWLWVGLAVAGAAAGGTLLWRRTRP